MMDLTGKEISHSELESGINMANIDIKSLLSGIYILSIRDDNQAKHCMIHIDG
jgi:Secretion system C-terminal sorting domain